jgi:hypothetical protein
VRDHGGANRQRLSVAQYRQFHHLADAQQRHSLAFSQRLAAS